MRSSPESAIFGPVHVSDAVNQAPLVCQSDIYARFDDNPASATNRTRAVFDDRVGILNASGATLAGQCVRTWVYVKDVDVFDQEMEATRSALFEQHGLNRGPHYLASTGIEEACAHRCDVVFMDAYSILGLAPGRMSCLAD